MKIGIVTYVKTATCNYGAELQGFALQYKLNKMGYVTEVLNLHRVLPSNNKMFDTFVNAVKNRFRKFDIMKATISSLSLIISVLKDRFYLQVNKERFEAKRKQFHDFFDDYIRHSESELYPNDLDTVELDYDTYIAGSDQIWNYKNSDRVDVFFLMFANRFNAKKISYAASFSVSSIPKELHSDYRKWINNLDYISVRETDGVDIVKDLTGRDAQLVCDPTLLLDKEEWLQQFKDTCLPNIDGRYLLIYSMSHSPSVYEVAKKVAKRLGGIKIYNVKTNFTPTRIKGITDLYDVLPTSWIWLIANADFVVTDSFHGTAFSINFNKQFLTIQKRISALNSRVNTILTMLNLQDRICYDDNTNCIPVNNIDFTLLNGVIDQWRQASLQFLINSLNQDSK